MGQAKLRGTRAARILQSQFRRAHEEAAAQEAARVEAAAREEFAQSLRDQMPRAHAQLEAIRTGRSQAMHMVIDEAAPGP
jgi:hypothetical protein